MATKRKAISKKIRFEVFKRDNFTCQYCGKSAPDIMLEIDHITPVKNGGQNDIMNLIAACSACNNGKGARELSDDQIIRQQQAQLKELNERREQMKMMLEWKKELLKIEEEQVDAVEEILSITGHAFSDAGRLRAIKTIKACGMDKVLDAASISLQQYYRPDDEQSISKTFDYVHRIAYNLVAQENDPLLRDKNSIRYHMRNNYSYINEIDLRKILSKVCISTENCEIVLDIAREASSWSDFRETIISCFEGDW